MLQNGGDHDTDNSNAYALYDLTVWQIFASCTATCIHLN